jgi:hypothetical protein
VSGPVDLYYTTGLHKAEILDLCEMIHREATEGGQVWSPILGLYKSVVVALAYMRRNRVHVELAERMTCRSRRSAEQSLLEKTPLLGKLLRKYVPTADELDDQKQYVVDGTLAPVLVMGRAP